MLKEQGRKKKMELTNTNQQTQQQGRNFVSLLYGDKVKTVLDYLYNDEFVLLNPIPVNLQYDGSSYIYTQDELNLWGEEKTLVGGEEEIAKAILKLYKKLLRLDKENKLGPYPRKQLGFITQYIA